MNSGTSFQRIDCDTAEDFVKQVRPSNSIWRGPGRKWGFRGQADTYWRLVPKAFREEFPNCQYRRYPTKSMESAIQHAYLELEMFRDFFRLADSVGLKVPGGEYVLSVEFEKHVEHLQGGQWPFPQVLPGLAIAQHHGVPTRLLDFTSSALVAAYFAAISRIEGSRDCFKENGICVWAVNLLFTNYAWGLPPYLNRMIEVVQVPTADNLFLNRQRGFFLYVARSREFPIPPIDELILRRSRDPRHRHSLEQSGVDLTHFQPPLVYQITAPADAARDILEILDRQDGISRASLMPTYDNIARTLEFKRDRGIPIE